MGTCISRALQRRTARTLRKRYDGDDTAPVLERWGDRAPLRSQLQELDATLDSTTLNPSILGIFWHPATNGRAFRSRHFGELAYQAGCTDTHTTSRYIIPSSSLCCLRATPTGNGSSLQCESV